MVTSLTNGREASPEYPRPALLDEVVIPLEFRRIQAANLVGWSGALPHAGFDELASAVAEEVSPTAPRS